MVYYILMPVTVHGGEIKYTTMKLGEISFKNFWTDQGFASLKNIIDNHSDVLEFVKIKASDGKELTIDEFLKKIEKLNVIT